MFRILSKLNQFYKSIGFKYEPLHGNAAKRPQNANRGMY